jgi:hypothetical protein
MVIRWRIVEDPGYSARTGLVKEINLTAKYSTEFMINFVANI